MRTERDIPSRDGFLRTQTGIGELMLRLLLAESQHKHHQLLALEAEL